MPPKLPPLSDFAHRQNESLTYESSLLLAPSNG
jgi:hypothetical protein